MLQRGVLPFFLQSFREIVHGFHRYDAFKGRSDVAFSKLDGTFVEMGLEAYDVWSVIAGMFMRRCS